MPKRVFRHVQNTEYYSSQSSAEKILLQKDGENQVTDTTFTNGSSIDLRFPGSGSKDGFEHSTYVTTVKIMFVHANKVDWFVLFLKKIQLFWSECKFIHTEMV